MFVWREKCINIKNTFIYYFQQDKPLEEIFPFLSIIFPFSGNCCWSPNPLVVAHLEVCLRHDPAHLASADETSYGHLERQSINNKHNK